MFLGATIWLIICHLNGLAFGHCLYGESSDCAFQCHCAVESECSGGVCPSGCKTQPLGFGWTGPACQIGNVALHKAANMTEKVKGSPYYPAKAAVDGISPPRTDNHCSAFYPIGDVEGQVWIDLGDRYKIFNVTIYPGTHVPYATQPFEITVYNVSTNQVICAQYSGGTRKVYRVTCTQPVIGRYIHYQKIGHMRRVYICELIAVGHLYRGDYCSRCPAGVSCNDIAGCSKCQGSYPPKCTEECQSGFYGINCRSQCGKCKNNTVCEKSNGTCTDGCQPWWAPATCDTYIDVAKSN